MANGRHKGELRDGSRIEDGEVYPVAVIKHDRDDLEPYAEWRERIEREGVPDPPVIFAGNWARKAIEDLEAEVERLRERCAEADRLLRAAYADAHPEDVPADVLHWLNTEA